MTLFPPADHWPHGVRARYTSGCRCDECRMANTLYARTRARARVWGHWNGLVSAEPARKHLRALSRAGVGRRSVRAACDVSDTVLSMIASGRKARIMANTERRILAVDAAAIADHATVSARKTWRLVSQLLEEGFTKAELARRLGYRRPALQLGKTRITARNAYRVEKFYAAVME